MKANNTLLQMKYTRVIEAFAEQMKLDLFEALDFFYGSETYQQLRLGIADLHCRSDQYVVDDLILEHQDPLFPANPEPQNLTLLKILKKT